MTLLDNVYGKLTIDDPIIIDLITSKPMQRLKHISQDGAVHYLTPSITTTRFEHSVGTWYLAKRFNRPIEEQIASLLHDTPHTAFSHVIDFVMEDRKHEYHDGFLKKIILQSDIPDILEKHHIDLNKVLNKTAFPLLDNDLPDISFDRLDYFLRDGAAIKLFPQETITLFLDRIKEKNERFYFEDIATASSFAILFMNCSRLYWLSPNSHGTFFLIATSLKIALKKGYITKEDFFSTDRRIMDILMQTHDPEITPFLKRLTPGKYFSYAPKEQAEFFGPNKPRFVDPWIKQKGRFTLLSDIKPELKEYFADFVKNYTFLGVRQQ